MQHEENKRDAAIESILNRLLDIRRSIIGLLLKLEHESHLINWPAFLDNFALISSHFTGLLKILAHESTPPMRNLTVLPLLLSQDRDESIMHLTEDRIAAFSHDLVPDYLRTKLEPATEERILGYENKANNMSPETTVKQVAQFNKILTHVFDMVTKARDEWDVEASTRNMQQTSSLTDTHALLQAIFLGKGLLPDASVSRSALSPSVRPSAQAGSSSSSTAAPAASKAPSSIKTNIKSANQVHPYGRP